MAIIREIPKCPICGEFIARAKYEDQSQYPLSMQRLGDNFIGWEWIDCKCKRSINEK